MQKKTFKSKKKYENMKQEKKQISLQSELPNPPPFRIARVGLSRMNKTLQESQNAARRTFHQLSICQVVFTK